MPPSRLVEPPLRALASAVFFLVVAVFFPFVVLAPTLRMRRAVGGAGARVALALAGCRVSVSGRANLPPGACVVVANHASYLDGLALTAAMPGRLTFLSHDGVGRIPVIGLLLRRMGGEFISRTAPSAAASDLRRMIARVRAGETIALFPEGTFVARPGLMPFHDGGFLIASQAGVPAVPVVIHGTRSVLRDGESWLRPGRIAVSIHAPVQPSGTQRASVLALRGRVRAVILAHCGEPDAARQASAAAPPGAVPGAPL